MVHRDRLPRRLRGGARLLGRPARERGRRRRARGQDASASPTPRASGSSSSVVETRRRAARRRPSGDPARARAAGLRRRARVRRPGAEPPFLEETLAFEPHGDGEWEVRGEKRGSWYAYDAPPPSRGIPGAGTVHHVAWASPPDEHEAWQRARRRDAGAHPTPIIDRFYFKSIYFREPSGVLFEIATIGPGLHRRRAARAPRRAPLAAAGLRASARATRAGADAAAEPARARQAVAASSCARARCQR